VPAPDLRLRVPSPGLLALPWDRPLAEWDATEVPLRDVPVGPSRHLVRFVETDGRRWALKELPQRVAAREYAMLRDLESMGLPAVRAAGLVLQPSDDPAAGEGNAILVTHFLERSWQYRRLFMRLPPNRPRHRARLFDAMAGLLVDLHRNGVFWGDCSLANTLFSRDGQLLQAWLVDAETSEVYSELSAGQRRHEVRWLLSEQAGRDIGDDEAVQALALRYVPFDAAATMAVADAGTDELLRLTPAVLDQLDRMHRRTHEEFP
jgi:Lipopolysaccharide kinase (Kdo/WaaP) family